MGRSFVVAVVVLGSGCLAPSQGRVDRDGAEDTGSPVGSDVVLVDAYDVGVVPDATVASDTAVPPDSNLDTSDVAEVEPCEEVVVTTLAPVTFDGAHDDGHVVLGQDVLYGPRRIAAPDEYGDIEVVAHEIDGGLETILTINSLDDHVADARNGTVLVWRRGGEGEELERVGTSPWVRALPAGFSFVPGPYVDGEPRRLVDGLRTAWGEARLGGADVLGRVLLMEGGEVRTLAEVEGVVRAPYVRGSRVAWVQTVDDETSLWVHDGEARVVARSGTHQIGPYLVTLRAVVWIEDGALRRSTERGEDVVHPGPCAMLAASGDWFATVCSGSEPGEVTWGFAAGDIVVSRADGGLVTVPVPDDRIVGAVAIAGPIVAWVEYAPGVGCGGAVDEERGTVWIADVLRGERIAVSEVGAGCWCCGAYWPLVDLEIGARHLAWSYGLGGSDDPWTRPSTIGLARLGCER